MIEAGHGRGVVGAEKLAKIGNQSGNIRLVVVECPMHHAGMIGDLPNAERCRRVRHQKRLRRHQQLVTCSGAFGTAQRTGFEKHNLT